VGKTAKPAKTKSIRGDWIEGQQLQAQTSGNELAPRCAPCARVVKAASLTWWRQLVLGVPEIRHIQVWAPASTART
jgi:hypothetical protein